MKRVTRYFSYFIPWALALVLTTACQKLVIDSQPAGSPRMDTDLLTEYVINAENPREVRFNISSTVPWQIKRLQEANWCTVTPLTSSLGALTAEICIKAEPNMAYEERVLELELTAEGIEKTYTTKIVQKAKSKFVVQPVTQGFGVAGGTQSFTILSNTSWEVRTDQTWVSFDRPSGDADEQMQTVNVTVEPSTGAQRKAKIMVIPSDGTPEFVFVIVQEGIRLDWIGLTSLTKDIPAEGEAFELEIDASIPWKVTCADPVVKIEKKNDARISVEVGGNNLFVPKVMKVVLAPENPEHAVVPVQELTLRQKVSHVLVNGTKTVYEDGSAKLDNAGGRARFSTAKGQSYGTYIWKFKEIDLKGNSYIDINMWPVKEGPCNAFIHFYIGSNDGQGGIDPSGIGKSEVRSAGTIQDVAQGKNVSVWKPSVYFDYSPAEMKDLKELKISILPTEGANMEIVISLDGVEKVRDASRPDYWKLDPDHLLSIYFGLPTAADGETSSVTFESFEIQTL